MANLIKLVKDGDQVYADPDSPGEAAWRRKGYLPEGEDPQEPKPQRKPRGQRKT